MEDDDTADREAQQRVYQVRLRQMAYQVMKAYPSLPAADAEALAVALMELFDENKKVTPSDLRDRLIRHYGDERADRVFANIAGVPA